MRKKLCLALRKALVLWDAMAAFFYRHQVAGLLLVDHNSTVQKALSPLRCPGCLLMAVFLHLWPVSFLETFWISSIHSHLKYSAPIPRRKRLAYLFFQSPPGNPVNENTQLDCDGCALSFFFSPSLFILLRVSVCSYRTEDGGSEQVSGCPHHSALMKTLTLRETGVLQIRLTFFKCLVWRNNLVWPKPMKHHQYKNFVSYVLRVLIGFMCILYRSLMCFKLFLVCFMSFILNFVCMLIILNYTQTCLNQFKLFIFFNCPNFVWLWKNKGIEKLTFYQYLKLFF